MERDTVHQHPHLISLSCTNSLAEKHSTMHGTPLVTKRGGCGGGWPWVAVGCLEFNGSGHLRPNLGGCGDEEWEKNWGRSDGDESLVMKRARW